MNTKEVIAHRRTIRRFTQEPVSVEQLKTLVDLSRLYASGGNLQPIRYVVITDEIVRNEVFSILRWAAYLPGFEIKPENRPMAYLVLTSTRSGKNCQFDLGAAATTFMLAAEDEGLATCCLGAFDSKTLSAVLDLGENMVPLLVIAVGHPAQNSQAVAMTGDVKYYEQSDGTLCVPKRALEDILTVY